MSLNALLANHEDVTSDLIPEYIKTAPESVRRRIRALKKLQLKTVNIQADFYRKVHEIETEFRAQFDAVNSQRAKIVNGAYEPAENELDEKVFSWMEEDHLKKFNEGAPSGDDKAVTGVPDFWLNTLRNVPGVGETITDNDEPILKYLTDITVDQKNDPPSFTINFHFAENPHFANKVLTKYYKLSIGPNEFEVEVMYDGPSIIETKGCEINWKEGKNVTEKTIKKKPKKGGAGKAVTKVVPNESFFRFFSPEALKVEKDMPDELAEILNADFENGQLIRDTVVDSAVLYFTGESVDDDDFGFGDGEGDEDGLGGSDDEEEE